MLDDLKFLVGMSLLIGVIYRGAFFLLSLQ